MAKGPYPSDRQDQYMVRFPGGLRDKIKAAAETNGRSMNAEIVARLEETFNGDQSLRSQLNRIEQIALDIRRSQNFSSGAGDTHAIVEGARFVNHYRCDACGVVWEDEWSCACNDKCPNCNKEIEPYDSEEV